MLVNDPMTIDNLIKRAHATAVEKGWWQDGEERNFPEQLMLMVSELSEALEEYRNGLDLKTIYYGDDAKPEGVPVELADVLIRIFDTCGKYQIPLATALEEKLKYNKSRPYRHGGKRA